MCQNHEAIKNSHIIPKFASRWLKRTSLTGKMRVSDNPNKPVEDTARVSLLCEVCEQKFSEYEGYFVQNIFTPYVETLDTDTTNKFYDYETKLGRFATSMAWRIAVTSVNKLSDKAGLQLERYKAKARAAMTNKAEKIPGHNYLYILVPSYIGIPMSPEDEYLLNRSLLVDMREINGGSLMFVTKLSAIFMITLAEGEPLAGWEDCHIKKRGRLHTPQKIMGNFEPLFGLIEGMYGGLDGLVNISDEQLKKISQRIVKR